MYCKHYGFTEKPFDVTPKPKFLFLTRGHREALVTLLYGIRERRGFIAMVALAESGYVDCKFDNAWLWLMDIQETGE